MAAADHSHPDERSPLLSNQGQPRLQDNVEESHEAPARFPSKDLVTVALAISAVALLDAGGALQLNPTNQILEDAICRNLFAGKVAGTPCGADEAVQSEIAFLRGWQSTLDLIPGLLVAVPYGFFSDKYGRKSALVLCIFGMILSQLFYLFICWRSDVLPLRLTWLSSAFSLIGGGPVVLNGMVYSIVSDNSPEASRTNVFFFFGSVVLAAELVFSTLASKLMQLDLWLPVYIGMGLFAPAMLISLILPETIGAKKVPEEMPSDLADSDSDAEQPKTVWGEVIASLNRLATAAVFFVWGNKQVTMLMATLLTTTLGKHAQDILLQFARRKYGWTWAKAGYLVPLKAGILLLLLLVVLPASGYALTTYAGYSARSKDRLLTQASCAIMLAGTLIIGFSFNAPTMVAGTVIYSLGAGYNLLLRSLLASVVEPHHRGTMFNTAGILESIGAVIAGPLLATAFRVGLRLDEFWLGLPFLVASGLFGIGLTIILVVRIPTA